MLLMARKVNDVSAGRIILERFIQEGTALEKLRQFIAAQGGDAAVIENNRLLPQAQYQVGLKSNQSGFVQSIAADRIGYSALVLGAGREYKGQKIDLAAGIMMYCRVGDWVQAGQCLAVINGNNEEKIKQALFHVRNAISIEERERLSLPLILGIVDQNGYRQYDE